MIKQIVSFWLVSLLLLSLPNFTLAKELIEPIYSNELDESYLTSLALDLVNNKRNEVGLIPLKIDLNLENLAKYYVKVMADKNLATHNADGKEMRQRALDFGIKLSTDFTSNNFTENIAYGLFSCLSDCKYTPEAELTRRIDEFVSEKSYNGPHYRTIYHQDFNAVGIAIEFIMSSDTKGKFFIAYEYAKLDEIISPGAFYDLSSNNKYLESTNYFKEQEILKGYENFFLPNKPISRVEALKILFESFKLDMTHSDGKKSFPDIDYDTWYYPYILSALSKDIVAGYEDGTFRPDNNISRVEALKIILNAKGITLNEKQQIIFLDTNIDSWYSPYVTYSYQHGLLQYKKDVFGIDFPITRGEFVEIIYKLLTS